MTTGIYKITNLQTNQAYYGSSNNVEKRLNSHKSKLKRGIHDNRFLQRSYDKYGLDNFSFIIVEITTKENLLITEQKYIDTYFDKGKKCFNLNPLAESSAGRMYSEETKKDFKEKSPRGTSHWNYGKNLSKQTREKISKANTGKTHSVETLKKMSEAKMGKSWGNHSENTKQKMSDQKNGSLNPMYGLSGSKHPKSIKIIQLDLNDNEIMIFSSLKEAEEKTGISFKAISLCINGKTKTSGGYKWKKK